MMEIQFMGPYGYSDPEDENSSIRILDSGYELDPSNIKIDHHLVMDFLLMIMFLIIW